MKNDFRDYAVKHLGMNGLALDQYASSITSSYISPTIIEERQLNVAQMDVFSRLMMDRIIFLGTDVNDYTANVIQAQLLYLDSADPGKDISIYLNSPGGSVYAGWQLRPLTSWLDYLFYLSFFPQLVAGPIVRARDFIPQIRRKPIVTRAMFGMGVFLILTGLFKKAVISDYISLNFVDRIFEEPLLYTGFECLMGIYGYALQIYCDFSGYSDMSIGIALLLGFRFPKNFDAPYKSATITEFWRRWHISLSSWLRDYVYISLGGNRKGRFHTYVNLMLTMLLGGLWHGAAFRFILWGALHGVALALHKMWLAVVPGAKVYGAQMNGLVRALGIFFTFNLVCFGWLMFRAESMQTVSLLLHQIAFDFHASMIPQILTGYAGVFALIVAGYFLHLMPGRVDTFMQRRVVAAPMVVQVVMAAALIWCVMQIKSSDIQPFIYFQF